MTANAQGIAAAQRRRARWLLSPLLLLLGVVAGWPLVRTVWFSLTDAELGQTGAVHFIGLANYVGEYGLLDDPYWWQAVGNTLRFAVVSVALETALGLGAALLLDAPSRARTLLRASLLVPWAIPTVVSARLWNWLLHDEYGIVNHWLLAAGVVKEPIAWTADPAFAFASVVMVDVWKTTPFMALLILAALQLVPRDCYEAARVDGVPRWTVFRRVTLPLILPGIAVAVVFRLLDALRVFDVIYVMTSNARELQSMSVYVREQLVDFQQVGYGSAAATMLFFLIALVTALWLTAVRSRLEVTT